MAGWDPFADPAEENSVPIQTLQDDYKTSIHREEEMEIRARQENARRRVEKERNSRDKMLKQCDQTLHPSEELRDFEADILNIAPSYFSKREDEELVALAVRLHWVTQNYWKETVQDFGDDAKSARDYLFRDWLARKKKETTLAPESEVLLSPSPSRHLAYGEQTHSKKHIPQAESWEMQRRRAAAEARAAHPVGQLATKSDVKHHRNAPAATLRVLVSEITSDRNRNKVALEEAARHAEAAAIEAANKAEVAFRALESAKNPVRGGFMSIRIQDEEELERKRLSQVAEEAQEFAILAAEVAEDARRKARDFEHLQSQCNDVLQTQEKLKTDDKYQPQYMRTSSIALGTPATAGRQHQSRGGFSSRALERECYGYSIGQHLDKKRGQHSENLRPHRSEDIQPSLQSVTTTFLSSSARCKDSERMPIEIKRGDIPKDLRAFATTAGAAAGAKGALLATKGKGSGKGNEDRGRGKRTGQTLEDYLRKQTEATVELARKAAADAEADFLARQSYDENDDQASLLPGSVPACGAPPSMEYFLEQLQPWRQSAMGIFALEVAERRKQETEVDTEAGR